MSGHGAVRDGDHRRRAGGPRGRLPPGQARPALRDPRRERADRRRAGAPAGTRCACSRRRATTGCRAGASRRRRWSFPTKDEMADYLEAYAERFELPVRTGIRVDALAKDGRSVRRRRRRAAGSRRTTSWSRPGPTGPPGCRRSPTSSTRASSSSTRATTGIRRSCPSGPVLVVGAGNSGAEIAFELAPDAHDVADGPGGRARSRPPREPRRRGSSSRSSVSSGTAS